MRKLYHLIDSVENTPSIKPFPEFSGGNKKDFNQWRKNALKRYQNMLGKFPKKCRLKPEVIDREKCDNYIKEKVIYNVESDLSASAWLCRPLSKNKKRFPAVLCCHGHGPGKDPLVGWWKNKPSLEYHKMISVRLAQEGYITITPDRRGYGDCSQFPNGYPTIENLIDLDAFYRQQGRDLFSCDVWDSIRALDVLTGLKYVDFEKIGCYGISAGATVAAAVSILDERVKVVSLTSFANDRNGLPSVIPLSADLCQISSKVVCSLIVPRPLQLQMPEADPTIPLSQAKRAAKAVKQVYELMGESEKINAYKFDGVMELELPSIIQWYNRWFTC